MFESLIHAEVHFMNDFSITMQIRWKFGFSVIPLYGIILLLNFAYASTAQLTCHVQNFMVITSIYLGWEQNEISIKFELQWKIHLWNGPQDMNFVLTIPVLSPALNWLAPGRCGSNFKSINLKIITQNSNWDFDLRVKNLKQWKFSGF